MLGTEADQATRTVSRARRDRAATGARVLAGLHLLAANLYNLYSNWGAGGGREYTHQLDLNIHHGRCFDKAHRGSSSPGRGTWSRLGDDRWRKCAEVSLAREKKGRFRKQV